MSVLKSLCIAFSIYSKIPMPQFSWEDKDMQYSLCFFPWVGALIGVLEWLWMLLAEHFSIGLLCFALVGVVIPILVSGGFHLDGYMDTMDAICSYRAKEERLAILKDPHIGAFSVIMLGAYLLLEVAGFSEIYTKSAYLCVCGGFFLARAMSGMLALCLPKAKKDGMLATFANSAHRRVVMAALGAQILLGVAWMLVWDEMAAAIIVGLLLVFQGYYGWRMQRVFGGVTGDTAGYFVTVCELLVVFGAAVGGRL